MNRRSFLASSALITLAGSARAARPPRILLRSSWQVFNIGDIAHTPGVLALIEKHIPEAETILWASGDLSDEVAAMEHKRFPKLKIVMGSINAEGKPSNKALGDAIEWCDFFLHGSGPSLVAAKDLEAFDKHFKKPYGVYGITYGGGNPVAKGLLDRAKFAYFRDGISLEVAKKEGVKSPIVEFGPDGAFAVDLANDEAAVKLLKANGLEDGKFLCCITRFRKTPYWKYRGKEMTDADRKAHEKNQLLKEQDNAPHRDAITAVVRETGLKVFLVPEDKSQMELSKEMIFDKLPEDVKKNVVHKADFWLTDEAISVYRRSAGLFGNEMHSPIMAVGNGIPAIVCRWEEQTSKGTMWRDIGLGEWLFDFEKEEDRKRLPATVLAMAKDLPAARAKTAKAREVVLKRQKETMTVVKESLPKT